MMRMMKIYVLILGLALGMWSCDDFLTVRPKSDILESDLFATSVGVEDALYGVYAKLGQSALYGEDMTWGVVDLMAQYFLLNTNHGSDRYAVAQFSHENTDARARYGAMWIQMYQTIGYTNNLINALSAKDENSMRYYSIYLGEALGVRAFLHFDLVRLFAPHVAREPEARGIPYVRQWTPLVTSFSTVAEVYASVIKDLKESERFLTKGMEKMDGGNDFTNTPLIHFNLYACQATLARGYWMREDMDSAAIYARKVIESEKFQLAQPTEIKELTAQIIAKKEGIWGIYNNQLTETYQKVFYGIFKTGLDGTLYPNALYTLFDDLYPSGVDVGNEMRVGWIRKKTGDAEAKDYFMKLLLESNMTASLLDYGGGIAGINMIRLPEMYLIMAEALLEKDPDLARDYFDTFIASRGLNKFKDRGKALTQDDINRERKKEFFGEGQEFYNMKRQMREVYLTATSPYTLLTGTEELYTLLIPDSEFEYRYDDEEESDIN